MSGHFLPCSNQAAGLRLLISQSLHQSLYSELSQLNFFSKTSRIPSPKSQLTQAARPVDFAAYFDLVVAREKSLSLPHPIDDTSEVINSAVSSLLYLSSYEGNALGISKDAEPQITTLSEEYYNKYELDSLERWWDMEEKNALELRAVEDAERILAEGQIQEALAVLKVAHPQMYAELIVIVKQIVLAKPGPLHRMSFGGISSFASWGAVCINQTAMTHWTDYYKKLVHECAHLLLFAMARDEPLLLNSHSAKYTSPLRDDPRPLDGIYHAAFVSAREALAFDSFLAHQERVESTDLELIAIEMIERELQSSIGAFWDCCEVLQSHAQLTRLGEQILDAAKDYMNLSFEELN